MRRLVVAIAMMSVTAATVGFAATSNVGATPGSTNVSYANAYSYAAGQIFDGVFCVDGVQVANPKTEEIQGPIIHASGQVEVKFFDSDSVVCTDDATATATVTLPSDGDVTLMAYWDTDVRAIAMLPDPVACLPAGMGRLTARNGAAVYLPVSAPVGVSAPPPPGSVDIWGTPPGGTDTKLLSAIGPGEQASVDLAVGSYTNVRAVRAGTNSVVVTIGTVIVAANSGLYEYLYGGNDGAVGSFDDLAELSACAVVTTTTTSTTTTPPPPPAVEPVAAVPTFTG